MNRLAVLLVPVAFNACRCEVDETNGIAPQIFVDVCDSPEKIVAGELIGGFEECGVAFGERDMSVRVTQVLRVSNPSTVELIITEVELVGDPAFQLDIVPETIGAGLAGDIVISVRPTLESTIEGKLLIHSNAENTAQTDGESIVEIPLSLIGVDNGLPDIEVLPGDCDFGRVPVGGVEVCNVSITNTGSRGLVVDSVKWVSVDGTTPEVLFDIPSASALEVGPPCNDGADGCPFAFTGAPPGPDEEIAAGATVVMPVRFTPDVLGNFQGRFEIVSSDPDESLISVSTSGVAVTPPTCGLRIKSVNGQDLDLHVEPLDNVILTTDASEPSTPAGTIVSQEWVLTRRPAGSQLDLTSTTEPDVGFSFNNGGNLGVDLAGEYCVSAQVFDDLTVGSVNECSLCFEAIPKDNFLVQLSWDTNSTDMDLHVTKESSTPGEFCIDSINGSVGAGALHTSECDSGLDCNWLSGCRSGGAGGQEWDGVVGRGDGDPSLDIDDTSGFGPENINVDAMTPGNYVIGVNAYGGASGSTVRVFIFGRLAGEFFYDISPQEWWEVALVRWPDGVTSTLPCIEDLTDGTSGDELAACDAAD